MEIKKAKIGEKIYDVVSLEEYNKNKDMYVANNTAINTDGYILPILNQSNPGYGIQIGHTVSYANLPPEGEDQEYKENNIIDFSQAKDLSDVINKQQAIKTMEKDILTSPDNLTKPKIQPEDSPEMALLKTAIDMKNIDMDKYESRFGSNYNNYKRLLNKNDISIKMLKVMCKSLDMKASLVLEDSDPDVANPMGKSISTVILGEEDTGENE